MSQTMENILDPALAMQVAMEKTGLDDFGDPDFLEPYRQFVAALNRCSMTEAGVQGARQNVERRLMNRLRFERDLKQHPEILDEDVSDPLVILGLARTGTTALHRMISADPAIQAFWTWRVLNPARLDDPLTDRQRRMDAAREVENGLREGNPEYYAAHATIAEDAEEDVLLHDLNFQHILSHVHAPDPEYLLYLRSLPRDRPYAYAKKIIQYLQWQDGGRQGRRWVMKSPVHIGYLDQILTQHPDATIIYSHRDLAEVLPSYCRLIETFQQMQFSNVDRAEIGRVALDYWGHEMDLYKASKHRVAPDRLIEVPYLQVVKTPLETIEMIYARAGQPMTDAGRSAIGDWIAANPPHKFGRSLYDLERYGLTRDAIDARLA